MEKKINLTIFFNYRRYNPKYKSLLEDVFYKRMYDEKKSSNDIMQEVMDFCGCVDDIVKGELDNGILSRFIANDKLIVINYKSIDLLISEHKDLDEDALLKNILEKQVQNILSVDLKEVFDITFEDILNKNGYVTPRKLSEIVSKSVEMDSESILNDIVGEKDKRSKAKNEDIEVFENNSYIPSYKKSGGFGQFNPDDEEIPAYTRKKMSPKSNDDYDFDVFKCVRRKDSDDITASFSDFVNEKDKIEEIDGVDNYSYYDELDEEEDKVKKNNNSKKGNLAKGIFKSIKEKFSGLKDKIKNDDDENDNTVEEYNDNLDDESLTALEEIQNEIDSSNLKKEEEIESIIENSRKIETTESTKKVQNSSADDFDYNVEPYDEVDSKLDSMLDAIMKEKNIADIDTTSSFDTNDTKYSEDIVVDEVKNSNIYDTFAEELETVESIRKKRRKK